MLRLKLMPGKDHLRKPTSQADLCDQLQKVLGIAVELEIGVASEDEVTATAAHRADVRQQQQQHQVEEKVEGTFVFRQIKKEFLDAKLVRASRKTAV